MEKKKNKLLQITLWVFFIMLFNAANTYSQQLAFPGAEGGGRFAVGGRGGELYEVTNLNDSGPGSLRDAVSQSNRTVVFKVSGVIHLQSKLSIAKDNITIAGQTAPGDGICITGYTVNIKASNIIIRYLRFRLSDVNQVEDDAMNSFSGDYHDIIIDHCSLSWSVDETGSFYGIRNFTLQWCILSESLYNSVHGKGKHGYGGIWGGENVSFHHNLLAHHTSRNPRFGGSRFTGQPDKEIVDFRNNVIYNWGGNSAYGGEGGNYNMVNNYYKAGPATPGNLTTSSSSNKRNRILQYTSYYYSDDAAVYPDTLYGGKFYINGNFVEGYPDVTADNWTKGVQKDSYFNAEKLIAEAKLDAPIATAPVTTHSAEEAYTAVLLGVGATIPKRDDIDKRIIEEAKTGTATYEGATYATMNSTGISHPSGIIDTQADVGGLPDYNTATPPADSDQDGIPDDWETDNGLNPNDPADATLEGTDGYSHRENYLNSIQSTETKIAVDGEINGFIQSLGSASATQSYTISAVDLTNDIVITPPAGFEISNDGGTTWHDSSTPLTLTHSGGIVTTTTISVRMNASSPGSYSGNIENTSEGSGTQNIPVAGIVSSAISQPAGTEVVVAQDGSGDYTTVQAAIDAAPSGRTTPYIIFIKNGVYKEKIEIPSDKTFLQLVGESVANTILTYDNYSGKPMPGGGSYGTSNSASVIINADDFTAINITFENTTGDSPQAVAVNVSADRVAFKNCRFLGGQDTLLTNRAGHRQYYKNCYIDGVVDFIFGPAIAVFDSCVVYAKSRKDGLSGSYITAANTPDGQQYGYVFRNCILPSNTGVTQYVLGRPWQNASGSDPRSYPKVVFLNTTMGHNIVKPEGWSVWNEGTVTSSIFYAEYNSHTFDGDPLDVSQRVDWSYQLTESEANEYTLANLFGDWDPCTASTGFCDTWTPDLAVSNFEAEKGEVNTDLSWNISWPVEGIKYELFRSSDNVAFSKIYEVTEFTDSLINFAYTEGIPPAGTTYYYYVVASLDGLNPHQTETVEVSSTPTIIVTGSLDDFKQGLGTPSAHQGYYLSAENLSEGITITPPAGFEVSADQGSTWHDESEPLTISETGGFIPSTSIWIRLNAEATGDYAGNISHTSAGAETIEIAVDGHVQADALPVSETLLYWPFTSGNQDDSSVRSEGATGSTSMNGFYLSNGTTVPEFDDYSEKYGMAFGPGSDGEALWTTSNGGPGGNLNRAFYQEFVITATSGYALRVDSIVLNTSYYNTESNTKLAVVYSKSGFTTADSTDVTGGIGPDGNPLLSSANGAFETPAEVKKENDGTTLNYRFAFAGSEGVMLETGESLTIRLYYSCGSTSEGRYAKLKDVYIKGFAEGSPGISVDANLTEFTQDLGKPSVAQTYTVSADGLSGYLTITPPANFEVSIDGNDVWKDKDSPLVLSSNEGTVSPVNIAVRLNANAAGTYSGVISHTSPDAIAFEISVSGSASGVTGLGDELTESFRVWPNPATEMLQFSCTGCEGLNSITVYNSQGILIGDFPVKSNPEIDLSGLSSGIYFLEAIMKDKREIKRIIKH